MTMPHLMNCPHTDDGWCLDCVGEQHAELERLRHERDAVFRQCDLMSEQLAQRTAQRDTCVAEIERLRTQAPAAKLTVHEDEVRFGVYRVTAELYAPGLPPGQYDVFLAQDD